MNKQISVGKFDQKCFAASLKKSIVVFLLTAVLLISMVGMASAQSQTWYFSSTGATYGNYVMYKGEQSGGTASKTIDTDEYRVWTANEAASCDVTFGAASWTGQLKRDDYDAIETYRAEIGYWDVSESTFVSKGSVEEAFIIDADTDSFTISDVPSFTIPEGDYLALLLTNIGTKALTIVNDGNSWVQFPLDNPDYPVPELPTIILMSTGLLALAGFVLYSRSRRRNGKAK